MSASPSIPPSGPSSGTPTAPSASAPRRRPQTSIFTQKKKPVRKPATQATPANRPTPNGALVQQSQQPQQTANGAPTPAQADEKDYTDYPIYVSKDPTMQGLHFHAMKLQTRPDATGNPVIVDPFDQKQFTRPLRLHRRNARDKMETAEMSDAASGVDDKEKELMSIRRQERQAEREANQALIAPTGGEAKKAIKRKPQKKVEDVYFDENNAKQKQRAQLRYEEARPWHLEDFEGKNVWVGSYEEPLSDTSVMFEIGSDGFRMIPVEKWYRFTQTNRFQVMNSEQVEKHMAMKSRPSRWFLGTQAANDEERRQVATQERERQRAEQRRYDDDDRRVKKEEGDDYRPDMDEIDFEFNDEFQDDDEGLLYGEFDDDETKETTKKIFEEQRTANLAGTGVKDEDKDWDAEEQKEKMREHEEKRRTKRMRKQLMKKERKLEYDSESSHGEFSESSESEDSEEERERLEEERKQEEAKKLNGDKSGASTKGTNTPTGRAEKRDNKALGASLKRPGSPDLSELSGNESSRKKVKSINGRAVSTSAPGAARSLSPDTAKPKRTGTGGSGSGSDTDTSRTGRPKIRLKNSPTGTPSASGSRAQSPQRNPAGSFPTLAEIQAAIPPDGVPIGVLASQFKPRVQNRQPEFIALVKQAGKQDQVTKKIMPKPGAAAGSAGGDASQ